MRRVEPHQFPVPEAGACYDGAMPPYKIEKEINFMEYEIGKPHWLSPEGRAETPAEKPEPKPRVGEQLSLIDYWVSLGMTKVTGSGRGYVIGTGAKKPK